MTPSERSATVAEALRRGKWIEEDDRIVAGGVSLLAQAIGAPSQALALEEIRNAARSLNRHLRYGLTCDIAALWRSRVGFDISVSKHHAQALINLGGLEDAEDIIAAALNRATGLRPASPSERDVAARETVELRGLFARTAKARFVRLRETLPAGPLAAADSEAAHECGQLLAMATQRYAAEYAADRERYWHGINAVALQARAVREHCREPSPEFLQHARDLIALLTPKAGYGAGYDSDEDMPWILASLSEAHLALGEDCAGARLWLDRLLAHPKADPFNFASYARQLREIWQGDALKPERDCASQLAYVLLQYQHENCGTVTLSSCQLDDLRKGQTPFEKNFSNATGLNFGRIATACDSIGCVGTATGKREGTGFLIDLAELREGAPNELVFVTNAHVISDTYAKAALRSEEAWISFDMETIVERRVVERYRVKEVIFSSEPGDFAVPIGEREKLDITIVRLDRVPARARGLRLRRDLPAVNMPAYVIGHPCGRDLEVSVKDSDLLETDPLPRLFHYRTPTDHGSSGSPVFNDQWEVIGVHHAGNRRAPKLTGPGFHDANEGIALDALCRKLAGS